MIRFNTEILNATEFGDQSVTQCPEVFEEKRSEQASSMSIRKTILFYFCLLVLTRYSFLINQSEA